MFQLLKTWLGTTPGKKEDRNRLDPSKFSKETLRGRITAMNSAEADIVFPFADKRYLTRADIEKYLR
jgi:hypothetical protein